MKTKIDCQTSKKQEVGTIDPNTINVVEGQIAFLARCDKCGRLHDKVMPLERYKAERLKEGG